MSTRYFLLILLILFGLTQKSYAQSYPFNLCVDDTVWNRGSRQSTSLSPVNLQLLNSARESLDTLPSLSLKIIVGLLKTAIQDSDIYTKSQVYNLLGDYHFRFRHYMRSLENYQAALNNYRLCHDTSGMMDVYEKCGFLNLELKHFETATGFFQSALYLAGLQGNDVWIGKQYQNLGILCQIKKDQAGARYYFDQAIASFRKARHRNGEFHVLSQQGVDLLDNQQTDDAISYYSDLVARANSISPRMQSNILTKLGHSWYLKREYARSLECNRHALNLRVLAGYTQDINSSCVNLAGDFFKLGMADSAFYYLEKGMTSAGKYNQINLLINGYRHLSEYHSQKGNFLEARLNFEKRARLEEELAVQRNVSSYKIIKFKQELSQKIQKGVGLQREKQIQSLQIANEKFALIFTVILTVLTGAIFLVFLFVYLYRRKIRSDKQEINRKLTLEMSERQEKEVRIREEEQKFRFLSENSLDLVVHNNIDGEITYISPAATRFFNLTPNAMIGKSVQDLIHPDFRNYVFFHYREMIESRRETNFILMAVRGNGDPFWCEVISNSIFDNKSGTVTGIVSVVRDIHEKKIKESEIMEGTRQKETLLKEIHHRVKNNFAILNSLINMQLYNITDSAFRASLTNLQLRIRSMALVHEMLYRSSDFEKISIPDYIRSMASVVSATMNKKNITATLKVAGGVMNIDTAIPVGLILTELITNTYLHAFPHDQPGEMTIEMEQSKEEDFFRLTVKDNGIGLPQDFSPDEAQTMGWQIIVLLCKQLEGKLRYSSGQGTTVVIEFGLKRN